ncbi:DUF3089 domain-containing protein [Nocardia arizonensis]|uniref:DUF3089 domain-containing protein n=1 Tax=Nocardia arizonensis TaxID=1141647 RepID=UPI0006CFAF6D|nr:DUF3089 domain-containing protein [Nocardia arizonensis]
MLALVLIAVAILTPGVAAAQPAGRATTWLCHPSKTDDPCDLPSDTTDLATGKVSEAVSVSEGAKAVDCFYLYPRVGDQIAADQDPVARPEVRSIASFQAARFSGLCRVFAPVYRQVTLPALPVDLATGLDLAQQGYRDVENAWDDYLANDNHGRGVIIISHSQGTLMARKLIRDHVETDARARARLVGAFLMDGNVTTARGSTVGGDFRTIPVCTERGEYACVVAYSRGRKDSAMSLIADADLGVISQRWGLPYGPGYTVACTDPGPLSGDDAPQPVTVPSAPYASGLISSLLSYTVLPHTFPHSDSTWTSTASRATGRCEQRDGYAFYNTTLTGPDRLNERPLFESRLVDINLGYDRLISIAQQQSDAWLASH